MACELAAVENFALQKLLCGSDVTSAAVRAQLNTSKVVKRKATEVGFFTTIRLAIPLGNVVQHQWDWNFDHRRLSHGGSFMCYIVDSNILELEAVTHNGNWPNYFDPDDFKEKG
jgi:hypothetical protein